jgi:hypothetical protein
MSQLVLVSQAAEESEYSEPHIRLLVRQGKVAGRKQRGIWFVDLDDLKQYEQKMKEVGTKKFDPTKSKE